MNIRKSSGFTLIEVVIVLLIGGILLASFGSGLLIYFNNTKTSASKEKLVQINETLNEYLSINQKLPCPASMTADVDTPEFGRPVDELPVGTTDCNAGGARDGTFIANGERNISVADGGSSGQEIIRIGSVPTRALNLPDEFIYDSYGSRFLYAVSADLATDRGSYNPGNGVIDVVDSNGNSLINPIGSAHYVVISHGPDQQGGVNVGGVTIEACPATAATGGLDVENCDHAVAATADAIFRRTILSTDILGANQYDDQIIYNNLETRVDIPVNAVMAFNQDTCPDGWSRFTEGYGRFIVGAEGPYTQSTGADVNQNDTSITWTEPTINYDVGDDGGSFHYRLAESEMPSHSHNATNPTFQAAVPGGASNVVGGGNGSSPLGGNVSATVSNTGGTDAIEHIPPYIALLYCIKN